MPLHADLAVERVPLADPDEGQSGPAPGRAPHTTTVRPMPDSTRRARRLIQPPTMHAIPDEVHKHQEVGEDFHVVTLSRGDQDELRPRPWVSRGATTTAKQQTEEHGSRPF